MSETLDLIEAAWHWDADLREWVLIALEVPQRGQGNEPVTHYLKDEADQPEPEEN